VAVIYVGCGGFLAVFTFSIFFGDVQAAKQRWRVVIISHFTTQKRKSRKEIEKEYTVFRSFITPQTSAQIFDIDGFFFPASNTAPLKGGSLEAR
jgi:hypothetical protein